MPVLAVALRSLRSKLLPWFPNGQILARPEDGGAGFCRPGWVVVLVVLVVLQLVVMMAGGLYVAHELSLRRQRDEADRVTAVLCLRDAAAWLPEGLGVGEVKREERGVNGEEEKEDERWERCRQWFGEFGSLLSRRIADSAEDVFYGQLTGASNFSQLASPAAHVTAIGQSSEAELSDGHMEQLPGCSVQRWGSTGGVARLRGGVALSSDGTALSVPRSGLYFIYAQLLFHSGGGGEAVAQPVARRRHRGGDDDGGGAGWVRGQHRRRQMVQYLYRRSAYREPILLAKGAATRCWYSGAQYELRSVHFGGVFRLRRGDSVFVAFTEGTGIVLDEAATYFGAFLLDEVHVAS